MIGCPKPSKGLNLDQKKAVTGVQILITTINFWVLTIKYGIGNRLFYFLHKTTTEK